MIADRRFEKTNTGGRFATAIAVSATLILVTFSALVYIAATTVEGWRISTHCAELYGRASGAASAEKVRLLQEHHEAYCD